jgi:hypothetical protein
MIKYPLEDEVDYTSDASTESQKDEDHPKPLNLPTPFRLISGYMRSLPYPKTRLLGTLDGENICVTLTGCIHPPVHIQEDCRSIQGRCTLRFGFDEDIRAYCIGVITGTGTAVIVAKDERMYVYTPPWSSIGGDEIWEAVIVVKEGYTAPQAVAAEVIVDCEGEIRLRFLADLDVVCVH